MLKAYDEAPRALGKTCTYGSEPGRQAMREKPCEYDSESGRQAKQGLCEYDSESGRQRPRGTCEYDSESGRQVLTEWQEATSEGGLRTPSMTPQEDEVKADHLVARVL